MKQTLYDISNFSPIDLQTPQGEHIEIRSLLNETEYTAANNLMKEIWGDESPVIPPHFLKINQHIGALLLGAFHQKKCIGMVYSSPTVIKNQAAHWSYRLAVHPNYQDGAIGRHLKLAQRDWCIANGFFTLYWSFDPMISKNAHINLNKLDCKAVDFIENMYKGSGSPLHAGFDTDRLIVRWNLVKSLKNEHSPLLHFEAEDISAIPSTLHEYKIIIPENAVELKQTDPALYVELQQKCKLGFQFAIENDLDVISFQKGVNDDTYIYIIGKIA